jgi:hypothetical protein
MENVCCSNNNDHHLIEKENEVHQLHVLLVNVVVPDSFDCNEIISNTKEEIEYE